MPAAAEEAEAIRKELDRRHRGRYQIAFCDGPVDRHRSVDLSKNETGIRQQWRFDNHPHLAAGYPR